jgi:hypothetical protein
MNQLMQPRYGFPSGRPDSNRRSPGPEPGGFAMLSHAPKPQSAQRESNPHFRHGEAAGYRYIMGTIADAELSMKPRAPSGTRTHVAALRVRSPRRWTTGADSERDQPEGRNLHLPDHEPRVLAAANISVPSIESAREELNLRLAVISRLFCR